LPIRFADDVTVAQDGKVYFTDASLISPWLDQNRHHNAMLASYLDLFTGSGTGRVLVYDPLTRSTKTLLNEIKFANGIALSRDEDSLLVAETFGLQILRLWIAGPRNGTVDSLTASLPGVPDGISLASDGGYWVVLNCKVGLIV
jgi:sugar lactone lactonase YvrE